MEQAVITGIAHDTSEVKITIRDLDDTPGIASQVFSALAGNNVNVDMIIQNTSEDGHTDISFTFPKGDLERCEEAVRRLIPKVHARDYVLNENIAKVSIVGTGMKSTPGVSARAFSALAENEVNILMISTSPIRLSVVIDADEVELAVRCLHTTFGLDSDSVYEEKALSAEELAAKAAKGR